MFELNLSKRWGRERKPEQPAETRRIIFDEREQKFFVIDVFKNRKAEVKLKDSSGKVILDFNALLPPKYKFEKNGGWHSDHQGNVVYVGEWKSGRDVAILLHEIGHAHNKKDQSKLFGASYGYNRSLFDYRMSAEEKTAAFEELRKTLTENESNAWRWGLDEAERIKKDKNIDLLKDFENKEELGKYVGGFLTDYEKELEKIRAEEKPYAGPLTPR
ncbi:MAG: hypothetical protein HY456_00505 [Parcubacteria group bacterium]|nr:hypothetical protein [Parcubacteria group bacterium]